MSDIINLRTARKRRERDKKAETAKQNRVTFGTPKSFRAAAKRDKESLDKQLDQHLLDTNKNGDE